MIQDIGPHKLNNHYDINAVPQPGDYVLHFHQSELLVKTGGKLVFPTISDVTGVPEVFHEPAAMGLTYLFTVDDEKYYLLEGEPLKMPDGFSYCEIRQLREQRLGPKYKCFAAITAKHLSDWYMDNHFCGRCGGPMGKSFKERAMVCLNCGYISYPRIMPAVIVGVTNADQLLITRYREGYRHNALIAGFTEIGETLEETVAREVMEETGLRVKNIRYYKSQPWGIANDILTGFFCDVDGSADIHMDEQELKYAAWMHRNEIDLQPDDYSLTNEMMLQFKLGKLGK